MLDNDNFLSHILNQTQVLVPESDQEEMLSDEEPIDVHEVDENEQGGNDDIPQQHIHQAENNLVPLVPLMSINNLVPLVLLMSINNLVSLMLINNLVPLVPLMSKLLLKTLLVRIVT